MANHQQLSDLLSYEEAVALKVLASETKTESHFMCQMAVRTHTEYERTDLTSYRKRARKTQQQSRF
ncbi:MAG: hypothetical protein CL912_14395 [Deltaproteobacteria bacterium]|nr:hypothetical protein [Deltaproteobacteria bacterium]